VVRAGEQETLSWGKLTEDSEVLDKSKKFRTEIF